MRSVAQEGIGESCVRKEEWWNSWRWEGLEGGEASLFPPFWKKCGKWAVLAGFAGVDKVFGETLLYTACTSVSDSRNSIREGVFVGLFANTQIK